MFVYNRSILTVLVPLALLLAVAWWSNHSPEIVAPRLEAQEVRSEAPRAVTAERQPPRDAGGQATGRT